MNDDLELLGEEHGRWQGWPVGAMRLYASVTKQQWRIWRDAGSPHPAPKKLMDRIDAVMHEAMRSETGMLLQNACPHLMSSWQAVIRNDQHYDGMLSTEDLISSL